MRRIVLCLTAVCTAALLAQPAGAQQTESWDFSGVTRIEFDGTSGDVEARGCRGVLRLSSASGDVDVRDCDLEGEGRFSSASGDVEVTLARQPGYELRVSSASGDAALRVADWGESFRLVLEKRKDRGALRCPFPSTTEEEFEENDRTYIRVTVVRGSGGPEILVKSASGSVTVR